VQAFNRALSQAEIQASYVAASAGECKGQPAITSITPNTGFQGRQNLTVAIAGKMSGKSLKFEI
jgi:hypothetical protein